MRAKDRDRLSALRDIKSKIMLEATKEGAGDSVDDAATMSILSKLLKQRKETAALYHEQGRPTWPQKKKHKRRSSKSSFPAALTEEEIKARVTDIIAQTGATQWRTWARSWAWPKAMAGQADGKVISQFVRAALQS